MSIQSGSALGVPLGWRWLRDGLGTGAIASAAAVLLVLLGIATQHYGPTDVPGSVVIVWSVGLLAGAHVARSERRAGAGVRTRPSGQRLVTAAVAGLAPGTALSLVGLAIESAYQAGWDVRQVLDKVVPATADALTWGRGWWVGPVVSALAAVAAPLAQITLEQPRLRGAALMPLQHIRTRVTAHSAAARWASMLLLVLVLLLPLELNQYRNFILSQVGIYVLMGVGLNIVVGLAGLLDLGYVAFFALGAYTYGLLSGGVPQAGPNPRCDPEWVAPFWLALALGIAVATLAGVGLGVPVLRMRGDYLAIVTLGFGEIIRLVVQTLVTCTGGPNGIQRIPVPSAAVGGISWAANTNRELVYLVAACAALAIFITHRLNHSRVGRAWIAMREDEDVAEAMGISLVRYKLLAFAIGASFAGAAGVLYAARQRAVFPTDFSLLVSINVLSLIILGGMGSLPGVVLGAGALVGLPELLREFAEYRLVLYGALLVAMMILRPEGLLPSRRRALEIHAEETGPEPALRAAEVASRPGRAPPDPPSRAARASRDRGSSHGP